MLQQEFTKIHYWPEKAVVLTSLYMEEKQTFSLPQSLAGLFLQYTFFWKLHSKNILLQLGTQFQPTKKKILGCQESGWSY